MSKLVTDECITSLVENHIGKENISDIGGVDSYRSYK